MAVAYDAGNESHTGTTGSTSQASFSWTHTPSGTPKGVVVFTFVANSSTETATSVTYGGTSMTAVSGGSATDTAGEPGRCTAWFLGSSVPTGAQTVTVNRTDSASRSASASASPSLSPSASASASPSPASYVDKYSSLGSKNVD